MQLGRPQKWQIVLACALLSAVTFAVYCRVAGFEFTNYDDETMVLDNPFVRAGLTPQSVAWALTSSWFEYWHPLTWLSHMLDCELFGLRPGGHHLASLGFHIANTLLLFAVLQRMTGAWQRSAVVAALFALHPLHVESVAWIAERKDVLSTFFGLLALWAYAAYVNARRNNPQPATRHPPSSSFYLLSLTLFACSLMSKPMLVTLPFLLLLLDYWPLDRIQLNTNNLKLKTLAPLLLEKLPFLALALASCAVTYVWAMTHANTISAEQVPWGLRLANLPVSYARYLGKLLWPADLALPYPMPGHWAWWQVGGALLILGLLTWFALRQARSAPYGLVGWLTFLGVLLPTLRLVQAGDQSIADRYTYFPSIGIFLALVWGAAEWGRGSQLQAGSRGGASVRPPARRQAVLTGLTAVALLLCACFTWRQVGVWENSETLFRHALSVTTGNFVAHSNLGNALARRGELQQAEAQFSAALQLRPETYSVMYALANVVRTNRGPEAAMALFHKALALRPQDAIAHYNHAIVLAELHQPDAAIAQYREALRRDPNLPQAHNNLAGLLLRQGDAEACLSHAETALRLQPDLAQAHVHAGNALFIQEKFAEAEAHYRAAVGLNPLLAEAHLYLGEVLVNQEKFPAAEAALTTAARLIPGDAKPLQDLAAVNLALKRPRQAVELYRAALRLEPDWVEGMTKLAWLLATQPDATLRDGVQAVELAARASTLTGGTNMAVQQSLAAAYAEAGMFKEALDAQHWVCILSVQQRGREDGQAVELRERFRAGQPYREP